MKPDSLTIQQDNRYIKFKLSNRFDSLKINDEEMMYSILSKPKYKKLKKLSIHVKDECLLNPTKFYNQFENLEVLVCEHFHEVNKITLKLNKLVKLINKDYYTEFDLYTPQLIELRTRYIGGFIKFNYNPIKLEILKIGILSTDDQQIISSKLKNLNKLIIKDWFDYYLNVFSNLINNLVEDLDKLTELHFLNPQMFNKYEELIFNFLINLKKKNLKIFIRGFRLEQFIEILKLEGDPNWREVEENILFKYFINNFEKLKMLNLLIYRPMKLDFVNNNTLVELEHLPVNLKSGLKKVKSVKISKKVENEFNLANFIEDFKVNTLEINFILPSKLFFDQIGNRCQQIKQLFFYKNDEEINFDFIFKLKFLRRLRFNQTISLDLLIKLIKFTNCDIDGRLDLIKNNQNNTSFIRIYSWLNHLYQLDHSEINKDSYFNFEIANYKYYLFKEITFTNSKLNLIRFLDRVNYEFKIKNYKDNNEQFIFLIEQFNYEQFLNNLIMKQLYQEKKIYIHL
jgi:hypothetical protein